MPLRPSFDISKYSEALAKATNPSVFGNMLNDLLQMALDYTDASSGGGVIDGTEGVPRILNRSPVISGGSSEILGGQINRVGGVAPFTWTISGDGANFLSIDGGGNITGGGADVGTYSFTVTVVDAEGNSDSVVGTLIITDTEGRG